jgi:alkylhydroperoxidase/carboxymuconolactone decarboxylase family protein YurZ
MAMPEPPEKHKEFVARYPALGDAWEKIGEAGHKGPLDERTARLVKLGIAIGAQHQGATHSSVRKAMAMGISREEIEQVVALCAGTLGLPFVVAASTWVQDELKGK